ncbi:MAG: hypothetical protein IT203_10780, partial [Fimbriimonadaceae bacterium]|nr:hypothetical protein [Fimbriimonadaceae bacterium]
MRGVLATIFLLFLSSLLYAQQEPNAAAIDRVVKIAQTLKPGMAEDKVAPLVTEAARLCGFVIWDEDRKPLLQPSSSTRLNLALTDSEIQLYSQMFSQGQGVAIGDVVNAYSHILKQDDMVEPITALLVGELNELCFSKDANSQTLGAFLTNQANVHGTVTGFFDEKTELNAIQALIILRVLTEDTLLASRSGGRLKFGPLGLNQPLFASLQPMPSIEVPGWQEDGYAGVMTSVVSTVVDFFDAEGMKNNLGVANLLSGIVKFVATYACLKGEITIEEPGSPLVRRQSTAAGERRTLDAKFSIDGTKATEFLKKNRKYFLQIGLDVDMPKSGPLGGIETKWEIGQSQRSTKNHLIQTVGQQDISKIVTDEAGIAKLTVEGVPRSEALDPKSVTPVIKRVGILVTPQVKSTEIKQDIVDA